MVRPRRRGAVRALVAMLAVCIGGTATTGAYVVTASRSPAPPQTVAGDQQAPERSRGSPGAAARPAPLERIIVPTMLAVAPNPITRQQLRRISRIPGVQEVTTFAAGQVRVSGQPINMLGIDPSTFRSWTPPRTASSNDLWRAVAMGRMALSFKAQKELKVQLSRSYAVSGRQQRQLQLAAVAGLGLPGVEALVNRYVGRSLGLVPDLGLLINAPGADIAKLKRSVQKSLGKRAQVFSLRDGVAGGRAARNSSGPSPAGQSGGDAAADAVSASEGKPSTYKELYIQAAERCPGLSWTVLAAIGQIESGHGRNVGPSSAGALGPMQFMPGTWRRYGIDGNDDGEANVMNPFDAVPSAARYLCVSGAGESSGSLRNAVYAYNHAWWYVRAVLTLAERYGAA